MAAVTSPKRFRVFVSSPYRGLEQERALVIRSVIRQGWIPLAMEFFPASPESSWSLISDLIDQADYVIALLAGRCGTLNPATNIPITEMEYDYAVSKKKPIARFVHAQPEALPAEQQEGEPDSRAAFERFRKKVLGSSKAEVAAAAATDVKWSANLAQMWGSREDLAETIGPALNELAIKTPRAGLVEEIHAGLVESAVANGITATYATRDEATRRMIDDIASSKRSCWISAAVYIDQLIKPEGHRDLCAALRKAAASTPNDGRYVLSFCSLTAGGGHFDEEARRRNTGILECWRRRERDANVSQLESRLERGTESFNGLAAEVRSAVPAVRIERRFFRDYLPPHSLVVIDERIAYVSFYDWGTPAGSRAPTLRLEGGAWGDRFVQESATIRRRFSLPDLKGVVFDFDGVIADSMSLQEDAWRLAVNRTSSAIDAEARIVANLYDGRAGERMFDGVGLPEAVRRELRALKDSAFAESRDRIQPFPGVNAALERLQHAGYELAIATTGKRQYVSDFLERHELRGRFAHVLTNEDVTRPKPDPEMLETIAARLGCNTWQLCMVGDTLADYEMARNAGSDVVLFTSREPGPWARAAGMLGVSNWSDLRRMFLGDEGAGW